MAKEPRDLIGYQHLQQEALRGVVRAALKQAAARGLPGEHHFFITFKTRAPGVSLPGDLAQQYPDEMTIALQHQFWDLVVTEDRFEVGLSFGGIPERLTVPFASVTRFLDPSAPFDLLFDASDVVAEESSAGVPAASPATPLPASPARPMAETRAAETDQEPAKPSEGAEVVRLDRFRKK